jgi:hypothetical protein
MLRGLPITEVGTEPQFELKKISYPKYRKTIYKYIY